MADDQQNRSNSQPDYGELLTQLQRIASALENPPFRDDDESAPIEAATRNVDYLALRQMMGRVRRTGEPLVSVGAARSRTSGAELVLERIPDGAKKVAVFTRRDDDDPEIVDLGSHPAFDRNKRVLSVYPLTKVTHGQIITRLEFRGADDYPVGLGPRLAAV